MIDRLTKRQREVMELVAEGLTNREVGERLGISKRTVEIHRKDAIIALGVETTVAAVLVLERARARAVLAEAIDLLREYWLGGLTTRKREYLNERAEMFFSEWEGK
jgi:DNA-binding CsgD family transcriptional regulator